VMLRLLCGLYLSLLGLGFAWADVFVQSHNDSYWAQVLLATPTTDGCRSHLYNLTQHPHVAGSPQQYDTALYVKQKLIEYGITDVEIQNFTGYLNFPVQRQLSMTFPTPFTASLDEGNITGDPYSNMSGVVPTWLGYSADGNVTAELVYVNYGSTSDYDMLEELGISVKDRIVIARYGSINRGTKVMEAELHGAKGIIIYSDPYDDGYFKGDVYPKGPWRPAKGAQRGSSKNGALCPGDASKEHIEYCMENSTSDIGVLNSIPALPISYEDAEPFLRALGGEPVPPTWQGALPFHYHFGPGPAIVNINVVSSWSNVNLYNVVGTINGTDEYEQVIAYGNHRDGWTFGATDPNSGTAALLEVARGYGEILKQGWKPRRSIQFLSWDAEEWGLVGSTYFGENGAKAIQDNYAVYINNDIAVSGANPKFTASGTASLKGVFQNVAQAIPAPNSNTTTLYDLWDKDFGSLGYGSDYVVFTHHLGIPSFDSTLKERDGTYGVYHSKFDDFHWMDTVGDPGFFGHRAIAQFYALLTFRFATDKILPFNFTFYPERLTSYVTELKEMDTNLTISSIEDKIRGFTDETTKLAKKIKDMKKSNNEKKIRKFNQFLVDIEKQFLDDGLPERPWYKHTLQGPGIHKGYGFVYFPGVIDAIESSDWDVAQEQIIVVAKRIDEATIFINSVTAEDDSTEEDLQKTLIVVISVIGFIVACIAVVALVVFIYKQRKKKSEKYFTLRDEYVE